MQRIVSRLATFIAVLALSGCASKPPQKIALQNTFDGAEATRLLSPGTSTIKGSALMRQVGGGVVTCAGQDVRLVPATSYAKERMINLYGSIDKGTRSAFLLQTNSEPFESTHPNYVGLQRVTTCDAQGFFKFEGVASGEFFVMSTITWKANPSSVFYEGGSMMRRVIVDTSEAKELVIAP